jgi:MFS family permease
MRTFTLIWFGQLISAIGSTMTFFALKLWLWDQMGSATALALVGFCFQVPQIPTTLIAGVMVDRFNRKYLMLLGDVTIALATLNLGTLALNQQLQVWHLYLVAALAGSFSQVQLLAYEASVSLMVPKEQYTRAGSMAAIVHYGSSIIGPALAGSLYGRINLSGIINIDLITFGVAVVTLLVAAIPQPSAIPSLRPENWGQHLTFGFRKVWQQPNLKALLGITILFTLVHDLGAALQGPMILARTHGNAQALASVSAAAGIGGIIGAVITTVWGGPKQQIYGMLGGILGAGLSKTVFGLGQSRWVWLPAQVCSSLNFPLLGSCRSALWRQAIAPEQQGRVFAAHALVTRCVGAIAILMAGPLADRVLEPVLRSPGPITNLLSPIFGQGPGAGMAVLYTLCSLGIVFTGLGGWAYFSRTRLSHQLPT